MNWLATSLSEPTCTARPESAVALEAHQLGAHFRGMLKAQFTVFFERPVEQILQAGWQVRIETNGRRGGVLENRIKNDARCVAAKWQHSRGHLVQHDAKRK